MIFSIDPNLQQLVTSATDAGTPVTATKMTLNDLQNVVVQFVDSTNPGTYLNRSTDVLTMAIGTDLQFPTAGTFTLSFGGNTTTPLAFNASPTVVQAALVALASIGANNVVVTGIAGQYYIIEFVGALGGAAQALVTSNAALLTPVSTIAIDEVQAGGGGLNEFQAIYPRQTPPAMITNWTALGAPTYGFSGTLALLNPQLLAAIIASDPASLVLQFRSVTTAGQKITWNKTQVTIQDDIIGGAIVGFTIQATSGTAAIAGAATSVVIPIAGMTPSGQINLAVLPSTGAPADQTFYQDYSTPGQVTISVANPPGLGNTYNLRWTTMRLS